MSRTLVLISDLTSLRRVAENSAVFHQNHLPLICSCNDSCSYKPKFGHIIAPNLVPSMLAQLLELASGACRRCAHRAFVGGQGAGTVIQPKPSRGVRKDENLPTKRRQRDRT